MKHDIPAVRTMSIQCLLNAKKENTKTTNKKEKGKQTTELERPRENNNPYILYIWITNIDRGSKMVRDMLGNDRWRTLTYMSIEGVFIVLKLFFNK